MSSSGDSGGVIAVLFAVGPATGFVVYQSIQAKYRNAKARYMPERVVKFDATNLQSDDAYTRSIVSRSRNVTGRNDNTPAVRAKYTNTTKD